MTTFASALPGSDRTPPPDDRDYAGNGYRRANDEPDPQHHPPSFWTARPYLAHVRQAAQARMVSPDAVLANVITRIATQIPPCYRLPAVVGGSATFDFMTCVVADTSVGKSAANDVGGQLIPAPDVVDSPVMMDHAVGSGEGIAQAFMVPEKTPDSAGKLKATGRMVVGRQALLVMADEGTAFVAQTQRKGTTIIGTLVSAWSGQPLGALNADAERRRQIPAKRVRVCAVINMQSSNGYKLFADELEAVGFTGRLLFASAHDPAAPPIDQLPEWPGPLPWRPPASITHGTVTLTYDDAIVEEIKHTRHGVLRRTTAIDKRRSQYGLLRCKLAGILALWDDRTHVNGDDWALAMSILDTSTAVLDEIARIKTIADGERARQQATQRGAAEAITETVRERHLVAELSKRLVARVPDQGTGRADLRRLLTSAATRHRFEAALQRAISDGYIVEVDGRITKVAR